MIGEFSGWLARTMVSTIIQEQSTWMIPCVQTVHILGVAVVISSMAMVNSRLLGFGASTQPLSAIARRYLPWLWGGVAVLLSSGTVLVVGEPERELLSAIFWVKMSLVACAVVLTALVQHPLTRHERYWEQHRMAGRAVGVTSLLLWVGILTAGRMIGYFGHG